MSASNVPASSTVPWWREPTKDQWYAYLAAWLGWTLDAFDFTIFLLIMLETAHGVRAIHHGADVAQPAEIADLVATSHRTFGGIDVLINNAVVRHFSPIEQFKPEEWNRALAVNLSSAFHTVRLALPGMIGGSVIGVLAIAVG